MADGISGTDWRPEELQAIVADYFDMLAADLSGQPYVKSRHRAALVSALGRSNGSIEFKYQNISGALNKLGAQWIPHSRSRVDRPILRTMSFSMRENTVGYRRDPIASCS